MKNLFIENEQQQEWLEKLATLKEDFQTRAAYVDEQSIFPSDNINALRDIGYTKLTLPKEHGGAGFSLYDALLLQETLGSYDGSTALSIGWSLLTVGELFENRYWDPATLDFLAEKVNAGAIVNKAVSEAATGSPIRGGKPGTIAKKMDGKWVIHGRKSYTTGSPELDFFITSAWIEEKETVGFFLIPKDAQGLSIDETWDVIAMRGTGSHDLVLENVIVDDASLVEIPDYNTGFKLNGWLLLVPATYLGIAQAARDYALQFATTHSPNSIKGTIAQLPNVQKLLGEIDLELTQARFSLYGAAAACKKAKRKTPDINNQNLVNTINIAKYTVTNTAIRVTDKAMRLVGARSLQRTNPLQRYYRDVRAGLHNPPMDDMTITKLAQAAIEQYETQGEEKSETVK